ncbi:MAG: 2-isopropylmalate synthase [Alphaproteobacteria bacterium]|nr:2-isopropylmalate synthase [Alphaproteobacteria bacterium]
MTNRIIIFDTTLRDGEQSPGMSMTREEKLLVAEVLDGMGIDVIEAGFAMASDGDFESVKAIAQMARNAVICSLARAKEADIRRAAEALKEAKRPRIHTFMSTSEIHLTHQFKLSQAQALEVIKDAVTLARSFTDNVEWSAMDATRTELGYLVKAVEVAIAAGATTINLPDTVGYGTPETIGAMFRHVIANAKNADKAVFSFHGQNDLGLATANSLAAVQAGARQIECTINGIGERAGNTSLEEVVMALKVRRDVFGVTCGVNTEHLMRASRLVTKVTGQSVQVNKAIVGANAFAHESGIHQDGMLKNRDTYEIMTPESVGVTKTNLVMGKHSGRAAFKDKLLELGISLGDNALEDAFVRFKTLADKKKEIFDEDILSLLDTGTVKERYALTSLTVACGSKGPQTAHLEMLVDGQPGATDQAGNGPVDALFRAIRALVPQSAGTQLALYQVHAVTAGTDAQAEVTVRLARDGKLATGHDADVDTLVASARAYISALNKLDRLGARIHHTDTGEARPAVAVTTKVAG